MTDPDELRARAASIFRQLRYGADRWPDDDHDGPREVDVPVAAEAEPGPPARDPRATLDPQPTPPSTASPLLDPPLLHPPRLEPPPYEPVLDQQALDAPLLDPPLLEHLPEPPGLNPEGGAASFPDLAGAEPDVLDVSWAGQPAGHPLADDGVDPGRPWDQPSWDQPSWDQPSWDQPPRDDHPDDQRALGDHPGSDHPGSDHLTAEPLGDQLAEAGPRLEPRMGTQEATWAATRQKLSEITDLVPPAQPAPDDEVGPTGQPLHPGARHPGSRHPLPRVLAIANQKGGVGKTTTAVNLGAGLAELGYRVLVVDLDPQGNASTGLGVNARNLEASVYDVILHDVPMEDVIEPTTLRNLFVVPATIDLAGAEIELVPAFSRETRLRRAVETVSDDYDFVVIDCPPSLGLLTVNGLAAAGEVVVPIQCEYYALEGLGQLLRNVNLVQTNLNHGLEVSTIVLTMYDARTRLAEQVVAEVRQHFGARVCRNVVPRTVRLSEAPSYGQPIIVFDPSSRGAIAYRELAKEVSGGAPQRVG